MISSPRSSGGRLQSRRAWAARQCWLTASVAVTVLFAPAEAMGVRLKVRSWPLGIASIVAPLAGAARSRRFGLSPDSWASSVT
jgi:hypothetical protein